MIHVFEYDSDGDLQYQAFVNRDALEAAIAKYPIWGPAFMKFDKGNKTGAIAIEGKILKVSPNVVEVVKSWKVE